MSVIEQCHRIVMEADSVQLPDPSDSSENDSDGGSLASPHKRPRSDERNDDEPSRRSRNDWDAFVQSGARLKTLAASIFEAARPNDDNLSAQKTRREKEIVDFTEDTRHPMYTTDANTAKLAYEKTAECMILERKLKETEVHHAAMMTSNTSLRESANASNERLERTVEALRLAGANAANARADADAAEAYAASLASQLESLRHVVHETKRATKILQDEHEQVAAATRSVESKLLKRETELFHLQKDRKTILSDQDHLRRITKEMTNEKNMLLSEIGCLSERIKTLGREIEDRDALEDSRKDRSATIEKELRDARSLLVVASSNAAETETTTSALKETIETILRENQSLHAKMEEIQRRSRTSQERLQDSLVKSENSAQVLRLKATSHDEQVNQLLSEKAGCEKQIHQLKARITKLEARLKETTAFLTSPPATRTVGGEPSTEKSSRTIEFNVPSLAPTKSPSISKSRQCCVCFKVASGLMKSCQCGNSSCDMRAHSTCLGGNTVRSASPSLPVVLCKSP